MIVALIMAIVKVFAFLFKCMEMFEGHQLQGDFEWSSYDDVLSWE